MGISVTTFAPNWLNGDPKLVCCGTHRETFIMDAKRLSDTGCGSVRRLRGAGTGPGSVRGPRAYGSHSSPATTPVG